MIILPKTLFKRIYEYGYQSYPEECVGALIGSLELNKFTIEDLLPIENNSSENRKRRYKVESRDYLSAEKKADSLGKTLIGFYHSHPNHPARPSQTDLDFALPNFVYIIVSIKPEHITQIETIEVGAFVLDYQRSEFVEKTLDILWNHLVRKNQ